MKGNSDHLLIYDTYEHQDSALGSFFLSQTCFPVRKNGQNRQEILALSAATHYNADKACRTVDILVFALFCNRYDGRAVNVSESLILYSNGLNRCRVLEA